MVDQEIETEQESNQSKKDISNKWLDAIYERLVSLNFHEKLARDGCQSIIQYVNIPHQQLQALPQIQLKNLDLSISDFDMMFKDINDVVKGNQLKEMKKKLSKIKSLKIGDLNGVSYYKFNNVVVKGKQKKKLALTSTFYIMVNELSELRGDLVSSLKHILWKQDDEQSSGVED